MTKDNAPCSVEGCDRPARTRGMCGTHHSQLVRRGWTGPIAGPSKRKTPPVPCEVPDRWTLEPCGEPASRATGLCPRHLKAYRSLVAG